MNLTLNRTLLHLKQFQWQWQCPFHSVHEQLRHLLSQCSNLIHLHQIQAFVLKSALNQDDIVLSQFIHTSGSLGFSSYAYSIFKSNHRPSIYIYNNVIFALSSSNAPCAIILFNSIRRLALRPDCYSLPYVLKAVISLSDVFAGRQIHCQAVVIGLDSQVNVVASLVQMYFSCGHVECARQVFDGVALREFSIWHALLAGYAKVGDMASTRGVFEILPEKERDVVWWTTLISGYVQAHEPNEAVAVFRRMQMENVKPDEVAVLSVLSACADLGALELGEWIHNYVEKQRLRKIVPLCNSLIDMYAKSGNIRKALQVFENMKHKTVMTWTTMISGVALHGLGKEARCLFSRMEMAGVRPNEVTFIAVLLACSHDGLVELGRDYFMSMGSKYGIELKIEHYGCMIDLLGRAGYLQEAKELVRSMPFEANAAIWGSLLAASTRCGDTELAAKALQHLIKLEPHNSGNYLLLSNTYAALGSWSEARMVRKIMQDTGVEKNPGVSFIEVNNRVYEFIAGDRSNMYFVDICDVLHSINDQLKLVTDV